MLGEKINLVPPSYRVFEDQAFRKLVNEVGLVVGTQEPDKSRLELKQGEVLTPTEEKIFHSLNLEPGHILSLSPQTILPAKDRDFGATNQRHNINVIVTKLRQKLSNPQILASIFRLGFGIGVEDHSFKPAEVARLIYCLSEFFEEPLSNSYLASKLYADDGRYELHYLNVTVSRFNSARLPESKVRIARFPEIEKGFTKLTWADGVNRT